MTIWDCFTFRNEFDCLEIRLNELEDVVDRWVLVEADFTFQGGVKRHEFSELALAGEAERFQPFADRLMHVRLTGPVEAGDPWERETMQRDAILNGLEAGNAAADDVVLIGDADEIPDRGAVLEARNLLIHQREQISFQQLLSFYHVDNVCTSTHWYGTQAVTYESAVAITPERIRRNRGSSEILTPGGWHFCNLGDPDWIVEKIESFSHDEVNLPQYKDRDFLQACIDAGIEMTGRPDLKFERVTPRHPYLPRYLIEHRERFAHLFSPAPVLDSGRGK